MEVVCSVQQILLTKTLHKKSTQCFTEDTQSYTVLLHRVTLCNTLCDTV